MTEEKKKVKRKSTKVEKEVIEREGKFTKREKIFIGVAVFTLIATAILCYILFGSKYHTYRAKWGIDLPGSLEEVVSIKGEEDNFGTYNTYHVFKYEKEDTVGDMVEWTKKDKGTVQYSNYEEATEEWLNVLNVKETERPNFEDLDYFYVNDEKSNEMILLKDGKNKKIYLLEYFMGEE